MTKHHRGKNEGSISKRPNGGWRAQVSQSGDRISKGFRTKNEALTWIQLVKMKMDQGISIRGESTTLNEYLPSWIETRKSSLRPKTLHQYSSLISHHILPSIGHIKLCQLNIKMVERYYSDLLQEGVGVRTIRIINNILHSSMNKAVKYGLLPQNPTQGATLPTYYHDEMKIFTPDQVSRFLAFSKNSRYFALYFIAITTGMRLGELLGLKWGDFDWAAKTVHIQRQKQYIPGQGFILINPKTKAGKRTIQLGEQTVAVLLRHKLLQEEIIYSMGEKWVDLDLVFTSSIGTPGDASNIRVDFNRILNLAGLPRIRIHDLRHTAASLFLNHRVPIIVVTNILGHSKPSVTLDIYSHVFTDVQGEAAKVMDQLVCSNN
jgi:integrase